MPIRKPKIDFCNEQKNVKVTPQIKEYMKTALCTVTEYFNIKMPVQVTVSFVDEETIREYNNQNRNIDSVTDVLSFPLLDSRCGEIDYDSITEDMLDEKSNLMLGDVVICMTVAKKQSEEYQHSLDRETVYLFVHSILHLLSFDHMQDDEKKVMREKEELIMNQIGLDRD